MTSGLGVSILVPAHDEGQTIGAVIQALRAMDWGTQVELVIIDDGSRDGTAALLDAEAAAGHILLVRHASRQGRGAALRSGAAAATQPILAIFDGDGEYDAEELRYVLGFIDEGRADAVFGSRILGPGRSRIPFWRARANWLVTMVSNAATNLNLTDVTTSCVAVRSEYWRRLRLRADGFDLDVELVAALARARARIWEVPISYAARRRVDGRKSRRRHTVRRLWRVITSWWRRGSLLEENSV